MIKRFKPNGGDGLPPIDQTSDFVVGMQKEIFGRRDATCPIAAGTAQMGGGGKVFKLVAKKVKSL